MAADPKTLPMSVVRKIQGVIERHRHSPVVSDPDKPFEVTATLQVDPVTGKILDAHFIGGWKRDENGEYIPQYGVVRIGVSDEHGTRSFPAFGKAPKPITVHTKES